MSKEVELLSKGPNCHLLNNIKDGQRVFLRDDFGEVLVEIRIGSTHAYSKEKSVILRISQGQPVEIESPNEGIKCPFVKIGS